MSNSRVPAIISRNALKVQKASPNLMFGAGVVGMVGTVILASKATLKLEAVLDETEGMKEKAKEAREKYPEKYTERDFQKDMTIVHTKQALKVTKLYSPAITTGVVSIGLLTGAHMTLNRRNAGLMAAYAAVDKSFKEYRERVLKEVGPERERELRFGSEEVTKTVTDEKGKETTTKVKAPAGVSQYARFFDESNPNYSPIPENSMFFLKMHQNYLNNQLQARGHVFLNEVFDALGMERTSAGAVVGWVKGNGDDFIDFGVFDEDRTDRFLDFMTGHEKALLLDFNVDGVIYDLI